MKGHVWLAAFLVITISIIGCAKKKDVGIEQKLEQEGPVLAKVGNEVITLDEFNKKITSLPDNIKILAESNRAAYLDNLIFEILLYKEALKQNLDSDEEIQKIIKEAKKKIIIARLAKEEIEDKIKMDDKELKEYYEEHKEEFMTPQQYRASHILVKTLEEAVEIVDRLNAGALFEELAKKYSIDVTNKRGGDVGYFSVGQMVPEFEDVCLKLKVGEISGPLKTQFGYHIVKLTDKKEPELVEFGKIKDKIEAFLRTEKRQALLNGLLARLKSETEITINQELLVPREEPKELPAEEEPQGG